MKSSTMRFKTYHLVTIVKLLCMCMVMLLAACSNKVEVNSSDKNIASKKATSESLEHSHSSNPCTDALTHSHSYKVKDHQHSYDCENTNKYVKNGHIHPATGKYPKRRHVHPNGANKHTHNRK